MNAKEAKEMIIDVLEVGFRAPKEAATSIAEALLALRYPCECGDGKNPMYRGTSDVDIPCPTCKGTGWGEKVLAIRDEDQTKPVGVLILKGWVKEVKE
jgi:hypothetical protein